MELSSDAIPGVSGKLISLAVGEAYSKSVSQNEESVFLILSGRGSIAANEIEYTLSGNMIVHFPFGMPVKISTSGEEDLLFLALYLALSSEDLEDFSGYDERSRIPYLRNFSDCELYSEKIKSPKTLNRTLLPEGIVPRLAIGTVETSGPDVVAIHSHPMLEQWFLGLEGNDITVIADGVRMPLKTHELLHIPLGSRHGVEAAEGCRLNYIWIDIFLNRQGQEWLKEHQPLKP